MLNKRLLRLHQIIPHIIPVSKSKWWKEVKKGNYPQPIKLGPKTTVWRAEDIEKLIDELCGEENIET